MKSFQSSLNNICLQKDYDDIDKKQQKEYHKYVTTPRGWGDKEWEAVKMCDCCGGNCGGNEKVVTLNVEGMSCGHCKMAVEKAVSALNGVSKVEVNLEGKKVTVNFSPGSVSEEAIKGAIADQGYDVV
ncbi:MAG TPA: copper chaperone CopZ [Desulfobacteria bacterium]|nr:copper chaperone CopZ [Desulfobacteria bacterium]